MKKQNYLVIMWMLLASIFVHAQPQMRGDGVGMDQIPFLAKAGFNTATNPASNIFDWSKYSVFKVALGSNITPTFTNVRVGKEVSVVFTSSGTYNVTWPSNITWEGGNSTLASRFLPGQTKEVRITAVSETTFHGKVLTNSINYLSVKEFGAVGDGTADDTVAIQAALDTGRNVYAPKGRYKLTSEVKLRYLNLYNDTSIPLMNGQKFFGDGPAKTVIYQSNSAANGLNVSQLAGFFVQIRDMAFEGTGGNTSTGRGIATTGGGPHNWWRIDNCFFYWWQKGIGAAIEDSEISNCVFDSCVVGIDLEQTNNGAAINQNKIRNCSMIYQISSKAPTVPGIGIRINGGQGHEISGLDCGNVGMKTVVELNGNSSGTIEHMSTEMFPYAGQLVSCLDSSNAGISKWSLRNSNLIGFSAMNSTDYPVVQGTYLTLSVDNLVTSGLWTNGAIKRITAGTASPLEVTGSPVKVDVYNNTTLVDSYSSSQINENGVATIPTATALTKGRFLTRSGQGGGDDEFFRSSQRNDGTYAWENILAYGSDDRAGKFASLGYVVQPVAGVTASADSSYLTNTPDRVLDGNTGTEWWHSGPVNTGSPFLKFDFGASSSPKINRIAFHNTAVADLKVVVQGSPDNSAWTTVGSFRKTVLGASTHLINPSTGYRYYRLNFTSPTYDPAWLQVAEVSFFRAIVQGEGSFDTVKINSVAGNNFLLSPTPAMTTGQNNTAMGVLAGSEADTGWENTWVGYAAGSKNKGLGGDPFLSGALNTYIGAYAGANSTNSVANTYLGQKAGISTTTGSYNVAIGKSAIADMYTSNDGVYIGAGAAEFTTHTGNGNIVIGRSGGRYMGGAAQFNTYIGNGVVEATSGARATGSNNVVIGRASGILFTSVSQATVVGTNAATKLSSGGSNTAIGYQALTDVTTATGNTAVGSQAGANITGQQNVTIGSGSGPGALAEYNVTIGNNAGNGITGSGNILLGYQAGQTLPAATSNAFVAGSETRGISTVTWGKGYSSATPTSVLMTNSRGLGTDITGGDLQLAGGAGTGTGASGKLNILASPGSTTGSTANTRVIVGQFDGSIIAGDTRFLLYDVDSGTLKRVSVGAADSGGSGYKVLRIPN